MNNKDLQAFHKTVANAGTLLGFKPIDFIAALISISTAYAEMIGMSKEVLIDVVRNTKLPSGENEAGSSDVPQAPEP